MTSCRSLKLARLATSRLEIRDDLLALLQPVLREGRARLDEIDDQLREPGDRRELHGALHVDHLGLHAASREMRRRGARVLRRDAREAHADGRLPRPRWRARQRPSGTAQSRDRAGEYRSLARSSSTSRPQTPRSAAPYSTYVGTSSGFRSRKRNPPGASADERPVVGQEHAGLDARPREERGERLEHAPLRNGDRERLRPSAGHASAPRTRSMSAPRPRSFSSMCS